MSKRRCCGSEDLKVYLSVSVSEQTALLREEDLKVYFSSAHIIMMYNNHDTRTTS